MNSTQPNYSNRLKNGNCNFTKGRESGKAHGNAADHQHPDRWMVLGCLGRGLSGAAQVTAKEVLRMFRAGKSKAEIAREIGKDKKAVERLLMQAIREAGNGGRHE